MNDDVFCPHCNESVAYRTFMKHKANYYNKSTKHWTNTEVDSSSQDSELSADQSDNEITDREEDNRESEFEGSASFEESICTEQLTADITGTFSREQAVNVDDDFDVELLRSETTDVEQLAEEMQGLEEEVPTGSFKAVIERLVWFLLLWQCRFGVSDVAMNKLIRFISVFFGILKIVLPPVSMVSQFFPTSVQIARQKFGVHRDTFVKYTVCPQCHSLYDLEDCFIMIGNRRVPRQCSFVAYPNHPQKHLRKQCSAQLLDTIILKDGIKRYVPKKVYVYNSVSDTLKRYLLRPQFEELCESWRHRQVPPDYYADLYDGTVWSQFQEVDGRPFLSKPRNYAFMMNVDWFRPYKHTPSSIGAIYLSLMNLPRSSRYKKENVFLIGLIPGPSEPPLTINTYLKPLVDELKQLWENGICCRSFSSQWFSNRYHCALLCIACDIPASRKVGGFLSHSARMGCNKCTQEFSTLGSRAHDTSLSHTACTLRREDDHRHIADAIHNAKTKQEQESLESQSGVRYSELLRLPYYRPIEFLIIDPMHNLFLGTAKTMLKDIWLRQEDPLISKHDFEKIQCRVDAVKLPSTIGRIPLKIASSFSGFTADQWKTWTTIHSLYALRDILPAEHIQCWLKFVDACRLLCSTVLTASDIHQIQRSLEEFCRDIARLYNRSLTPNMHLHHHLCNSIMSYGPTYAFWLFSFERYNGILGAYKTNNKSMEIQLMRKFVYSTTVCDSEFPQDFRAEMLALMRELQDQSSADVGSNAISQIESSSLINLLHLQSSAFQVPQTDTPIWSTTSQNYSRKSTYETSAFSPSELRFITKMYTELLGPLPSDCLIPEVYTVVKSVEIAGVKIGSSISVLDRSCYVMAIWTGPTGQVNMEGEQWPGRIDHFLEHSIRLNGKWGEYLIANVSWFEPHPDKNVFVGVKMWCAHSHVPFGPSTFMPVQRVVSLFTPAKETLNGDSVMFVLPHNRRFLF